MSSLPVVGKYQLIRKLATGGMAEVYLAKTAGAHGFEKTVVLKRILPHLAEDENFVHMFLSEAKLAAQLNHPNVVTVFDFGEDQGAYFLVMEYIDGPNLRALFKRANETKQPIPFGIVAKIISFACEGLAFAHEFIDPDTTDPMNLVHRDISPDNILLARNGGVKVVDFGIAKASNQTHHTRTGTIKGKFAYMPPEQLRGQPLDKRADIFALGIVLHELVAGVKPFEIASDAVIMQAILYEKMKPASETRPDTPPILQTIIDRALEKDREARYPDCRTMQAELERFIFTTGEPVGQNHLSQLVKKLASTPSGSHPMVVGPPKTPSHPSLAVATPGFVKDGGPSRVSQVGAQAVSPSMVMPDIAIELSQGQAAPAPAPTSVVGPPPSAPRPQLEVVVDPGQVHIRSSAVLPIPDEPKRGKAWVVVLAVGLVFLGAGGALLAVKVLNSPPSATPVELPKPPPPVEVAAKIDPPPPEAPPKPEVVVAPSPAPQPVAVVEPPPAKPGKVVKKPGKTPVKPEKKPVVVAAVEPAPTPKQHEPPPPAPAPTPVKAAEMTTVAFRVRPYATIVVDGKYLGDTPVQPISAAVGTHIVVNLTYKSESGTTKEARVPYEVKAGPNVFKYNFEE